MTSPKTKTLIPVVLAAFALLSGCAQKAQSAATSKPQGLPVRAVAVAVQDMDETLALTGTLRPRQQVQIVAEVAARLVRVVRDEGARVQAGDVLAELDETDYRLSHERAKAALAVAAANQAHAVVERDRADNLLKTGGITEKDRLSAQVNLQVAEASLAQAKAEAAIAAQQQARAHVTAPFGGRVARRLADAGTMLSSGMPLFTLVDDSVLEFRAAVPSADYAKVRVGAEAAVSVDALPAHKITGKVARVTPLVDERTRSFEVVVQVPGSADLVGGLFARAELRVGHVKDALVVPPGALVRDGQNGALVFVVQKGAADRRNVSLGFEAPLVVQVTQGLAAGDMVILDPPSVLAPGTPVELQK